MARSEKPAGNRRAKLNSAADRAVFELGGWLSAANQLGLTPEGLKRRVRNLTLDEGYETLDELRELKERMT